MPSDMIASQRTIRSTPGGLRPAVVPIEIVLAYQQAVVRSGLRMLLDSVRDFKVVADAADVEGARRYVRGHHPRVLVLDLDQPGESALAAISDIRDESPGTRIVVMSIRQDPAFVRAALAAGALGYVEKAASAGEFTEAVRRAGSGQTYLSPGLGAAVASRHARAGPSELTPRESEVIGLIAVGYTNAEIAERLFLSIRTIETHRAHIQQKVGHLTRAQLVSYARDHGMVGAEGCST